MFLRNHYIRKEWLFEFSKFLFIQQPNKLFKRSLESMKIINPSVILEDKIDGKELFESYRDDNPLGAAYEVEAKDPTKLASLAKKIKDIPNVNSVNYGGDSTQSMVSTLNTIQTGGTVFIVGLVIVALFMISNTIKITITARSTEISIMRMVGASNWYIRIPFMLEGMLIGLFGAIIPIFVLVYGYGALYNYTGGSLMSSMLVLKAPMPFIRDFSFILAGLGAGVGLIGSFVSIRRFLKF